MRKSVSEPILKSVQNNFGNGYGQYCILDYGPVKQSSKKISRDKIKIRIGTPAVSSKNLHLMDSNPYNRQRLFLAGLYVTTAVIIGLEYWFCFTPFLIKSPHLMGRFDEKM